MLNVWRIKQLAFEFLFDEGLVHAKEMVVNALHQYLIDCLLVFGEGCFDFVVANLIIVHDFLSKFIFVIFCLIFGDFQPTDILI